MPIVPSRVLATLDPPSAQARSAWENEPVWQNEASWRNEASWQNEAKQNEPKPNEASRRGAPSKTKPTEKAQ